MAKTLSNTLEEYDLVIESIHKNVHLLKKNNPSSYYKFNNRLLLSDNPEFLSAVKNDVGGEIILDMATGPFLYFGDEYKD